MFDIQFLGCKLNHSTCKILVSWVVAMLCPNGISISPQIYKCNIEIRYALVLFECKATRVELINEKSSSPEFTQL